MIRFVSFTLFFMLLSVSPLAIAQDGDKCAESGGTYFCCTQVGPAQEIGYAQSTDDEIIGVNCKETTQFASCDQPASKACCTGENVNNGGVVHDCEEVPELSPPGRPAYLPNPQQNRTSS